MKIRRICYLFALACSMASVTVSCNNDPEKEKSGDANIISFSFEEDYIKRTPVIDQEKGEIVFIAPDESDLTKLTPVITISEKATITPATGEKQDFTNPVTYTVKAENGTVKVYTVKKDPRSGKANILSFTFEGGIITQTPLIDQQTGVITFIDPDGADLTQLVPVITVSDNATVSPATGVKQDFTKPVTYTVTAEDGAEKVYTVTKDPRSKENKILSFTFAGNVITQTPIIDHESGMITYIAPLGADLSQLEPVITISEKATITPATGVKQDFTNDVTYTVTAENGTEKVYIITKDKRSRGNDILNFTFQGGLIQKPTIDRTEILFIASDDIDLSQLVPDITISEKATISPATGVKQDFTKPVIYTVTAENGGTKVYTVMRYTPSGEANITSFTFAAGVTVRTPVIDHTNGKITFVANDVANLKTLVPVITVSDKATIAPMTSEAQDFTNPVTYTVTAENGKTKVYTVTNVGLFYDFEQWIRPNKKDYFEVDKGWGSSNEGAAALIGFKMIDRYVVTESKPEDAYTGSKAAKIETVDSKGANLVVALVPKVTSGSLFLGKFITDLKNTLKSTKFGNEFHRKPVSVKGYYKYAPGPDYYRCTSISTCHQAKIDPNTTDECSINAVLYEVTDYDDQGQYLTGVDVKTSERIVAVAQLADGTAKSVYTPFEIKFNYIKDYDPAKKYRFSIICSSSKDGDKFNGAPGSVLFVDSFELTFE